jgi:hypothetical protein
MTKNYATWLLTHLGFAEPGSVERSILLEKVESTDLAEVQAFVNDLPRKPYHMETYDKALFCRAIEHLHPSKPRKKGERVVGKAAMKELRALALQMREDELRKKREEALAKEKAKVDEIVLSCKSFYETANSWASESLLNEQQKETAKIWVSQADIMLKALVSELRVQSDTEAKMTAVLIQTRRSQALAMCIDKEWAYDRITKETQPEVQDSRPIDQVSIADDPMVQMVQMAQAAHTAQAGHIAKTADRPNDSAGDAPAREQRRIINEELQDDLEYQPQRRGKRRDYANQGSDMKCRKRQFRNASQALDRWLKAVCHHRDVTLSEETGLTPTAPATSMSSSSSEHRKARSPAEREEVRLEKRQEKDEDMVIAMQEEKLKQLYQARARRRGDALNEPRRAVGMAIMIDAEGHVGYQTSVVGDDSEPNVFQKNAFNVAFSLIEANLGLSTAELEALINRV